MSTQNSAVEIRFRLHATGARQKRPGLHDARPDARVGRLPRVTQVMALAVQFQDMLQRGDARDYADLARLGCITRERMSQIMELIWLAPAIQQEVLAFPSTSVSRFPISERALRTVADRFCWHEQGELWRKLKQDNHLD
jgi:hypothetical protein